MVLFSVDNKCHSRVWSHKSLQHRKQNHCLDRLEMFFSWVWLTLLGLGCLYASRNSVMMCLTHWGTDKMAAILQTTFFKCIFLNENAWILIRISLMFVPVAPVSLAGDATALIRRTKKITDTQQNRRDGLVEHFRCYYFACVAYQLHINDAWVTHMRRIWRMNGDATAYDVAYENLTNAYWRRKWRMHSVHPMNVRWSTRSMAYGVHMYSAWAAYMPNLWIHLIICELWMWHLNVHVVEYICI